MSQYAHLSEPDPEFPEIPRNAGPLTVDDIPTIREMMSTTGNALNAHRLPPDSTYTVKDHTIAVDGVEIVIRTVSPTPLPNEDPEYPVLVYFHGGGWIAGDLNTDDFTLRMLSVELRLASVNVDYRLAPEFPFPAAINDCYAALKWTVNNCKSMHGSLDKGLIVGGASAGANLAAAVTHRSMKDPFFEKHKLSGHLLQIPALIHPAAYPPEYASELLSFTQNAEAPILSKAGMNLFYDCLKGPSTDPDVSPLLADHAGLPPAYIQVCGLDPLRDEGLLYDRLLREQGVSTRLDIYPGVPHGFNAFAPSIAATKKWEADLRAGLKWLLPSAF
ncbi:Abhydrolase-3 domain-containing protein [Mycena sanguinolenta]|uniref:Abhydrolase-3 domain-containing protein n=1 Tax=Mycena sanguinolenta TaxID=230812 RepID=A0A8H6XJS5_9AGAR|nr:Abhydrolase-3 domain-containing protein [Mycena sanguinolenta]